MVEKIVLHLPTLWDLECVAEDMEAAHTLDAKVELLHRVKCFGATGYSLKNFLLQHLRYLDLAGLHMPGGAGPGPRRSYSVQQGLQRGAGDLMATEVLRRLALLLNLPPHVPGWGGDASSRF